MYNASYETTSTTTKIHMSHRTVITNLTQGQSAWVSGLGSQSFGNVYQLASFKGFLYSPPQGVKVVWWAVKTQVAPLRQSDLSLTNVPINIGNAWSGTQATIPASAPGIYYIVYGAVTQPNAGVNVQLYFDGKVVASALVMRIQIRLRQSTAKALTWLHWPAALMYLYALLLDLIPRARACLDFCCTLNRQLDIN
jgi:hypothetical protein